MTTASSQVQRPEPHQTNTPTVNRRRNQFVADARMVLTLLLVACIATATMTLARPRTYTATASFMPQSRRGVNQSALGLAATLGVSLPTGDASTSPQFFADLVRSRGILGPIVESSFPTALPGEAGAIVPLLDLLESRGPTAAARRADGIKRLAQRIATSVSLKTGVVTISVETSSPTASAAVVDSIIHRVSEYNLRGRRQQANAERLFVEQRLALAREELRVAEDKLLQFLRSNRDLAASPQLSFEQQRLQREVGFKQQAVATLVQAYEQVRIEEMRDTPLLTIVDSPEVPQLPDSRRLLSSLVLAAMGAGFAGVALAVVRRNYTRLLASAGLTGTSFRELFQWS